MEPQIIYFVTVRPPIKRTVEILCKVYDSDVTFPAVLESSNWKYWYYRLHVLDYLVGKYIVHIKLHV